MDRDAILNMLRMQHRMNTRVHEDWIAQKFEWYRATWIECGELMDHVGYKWWKKQTPDMEQVRLEVVDIWHFGMSALFEPDIDIERWQIAYMPSLLRRCRISRLISLWPRVFSEPQNHWQRMRWRHGASQCRCLAP